MSTTQKGDTMAGEIEAAAEKKLKSRLRKFKKVLGDDSAKNMLFDQIGASVEIYLPTKNPEEESDSIIFYTTAEGHVVDAEYSYIEGENPPIPIPISDKDLDLLVELFGDFKIDLSF